VQWYQDVPHQHAIVTPFSRYTNELKASEHVQTIVNRALLMATTGSPGPVYLTATREVLASKAERPKKAKIPSCNIGGLSREAVKTIANALIRAERPLVITGYIGRSHSALESLIQLANTVGSLKVFDAEQREMSFPVNHPAWLSRSTGAGPAIKSSDVILVLDADVPWISSKVRPDPEATIFHIDLDPRKEKMNLFDIQSNLTFHADVATALPQVCDFIHKNAPDLSTRGAEERKETYNNGITLLAGLAEASKDGLITKNFLFRKLREAMPEDAIFVHDAVTNQVSLSEQLQLSRPGSNFSKGGSGLGWACGAAIGISLASRRYDTSNRPNVSLLDSPSSGKFVCMIIGDGSFVFSTPSAGYWAAYRHKTPFLTVIINNGGWKATRSCLNDVHPDGMAASMSDGELGIDLEFDGPDYGGIAKAASNGNLWTRKVERCEELEQALQDAIEAVEGGTGAVIDAVVKN
jgi:thiamine pyrophosphate-dependent acetolactate synthase large subunit-like protein